jgi:UDP-4-amino-4,6-dideoxy-N-acetyl-beta-L-altrosamine transaminase
MIPYGHQFIDSSDIKAVEKTLRSNWLTQGPAVVLFEKFLAKVCGARYAVAVSSGTAALHLAYLAAGLKEGDEVITTPNTFVATTNMLLAVGAKPVFCDIRLGTYNIDETKIELLITKRTKAIVPVHFAGMPCDMDKILKIAREHNLIVIEDACHALGANYKGKPIGAVGDLTVFSFHPVKSITTGEGGAIVTDNKNFAERVRLLRSHGVIKDKKGFNVMEEFGYNYRMSDIQASLGVSQIRKLKRFIKERARVVRQYKNYLGNINGIILPGQDSEGRSANHLYVIRVKNPKDRLPLYQYLKGRGIGVNFHYPAVYSHPYYKKIGYGGINLTNENLYRNSCITLPCYPTLSKSDIKVISSCIREFFEKIN